jgi:hypothetical protein
VARHEVAAFASDFVVVNDEVSAAVDRLRESSSQNAPGCAAAGQAETIVRTFSWLTVQTPNSFRFVVTAGARRAARRIDAARHRREQEDHHRAAGSHHQAGGMIGGTNRTE